MNTKTEKRCTADIYTGWDFYRCPNPAKVGDKCGVHAPKAVAKDTTPPRSYYLEERVSEVRHVFDVDDGPTIPTLSGAKSIVVSRVVFHWVSRNGGPMNLRSVTMSGMYTRKDGRPGQLHGSDEWLKELPDECLKELPDECLRPVMEASLRALNGDYVAAGAKPHPDDKQLAANVAHLRKAHRLTQKQLADAMVDAGQSAWRQTTVSRVENGQQRLTGADLLALQEILGTAVLDGTEAAQLMAASFPQVRDQAAARALAEAERALQQALDTVQHLQQFVDDCAKATVAELEQARDYWQHRADVGSAYTYGQRYADACRAELESRGY